MVLIGADLRGEGTWLATLAALTSIELAWWAFCWVLKIAPAPYLGTYLLLAAAGLVGALALHLILRPGAKRASWPTLLLGTLLVALGASLFLPLKYAIPQQIPFWLDARLAFGERQLFGTDPWRIADSLFGWALVPTDCVYGLWLPVQSLVLFSVMLLPPSPDKSRALISYGLAWFLLGVVMAVLLSSAGPLFYDRLFGSHEFAALDAKLRGGAWMARGESDAMWASFVSGRPGLIAGISAMPSIHVAISFWLWLVARDLARSLAPVALAYAIFIWIASIQLGWHYFSDGLAGVIGMTAIWWLARIIGSAASASATDPSFASAFLAKRAE
ncbi:MAG TPA: phosphatase PAP2 family protein [Sphingomicrobium sp.]|nr:phosphatase PAP2 family protein [Sphingomicrobium sp.]